MSVRMTAFVVIRLEGDAQPDDVAAERVFLTREEAEAEVEHLNTREDSSRRYTVKESHFFSGSAASLPDDVEG
jgi:hypothetical protein